MTRAWLLADPERRALAVKPSGDGVTIALPERAPDPVASVLCLETDAVGAGGKRP